MLAYWISSTVFSFLFLLVHPALESTMTSYEMFVWLTTQVSQLVIPVSITFRVLPRSGVLYNSTAIYHDKELEKK